MIRLADIFNNQYVIRLAKFLLFKINVMKNYILEIWHSRLEHFSYGGMQIFTFVVLGIKFKSDLSSKIYGSCIVDRQQW